MTDPAALDWTQPVCERCWIEREAIWDETATDVIIGLKLPVRIIEPDLETCSFCGLPTFIGVYVRADPATVPYPRPKTQETDDDREPADERDAAPADDYERRTWPHPTRPPAPATDVPTGDRL